MNLTGLPVYAKGTKRKREKITDRPFLDWLKTLACCFCHRPPPGDPGHVRLGGRSAMGRKPLFSAVPLCRECHTIQHSKGHSALMPTEKWLELADHYYGLWLQREQK